MLINSKYDIDGAIFDVDGTILDSMGVWRRATSKFYENHGLRLSDEEAELFSHMTLDESLPYIKDKYSLSITVEEIELELKELISNAYRFEVCAKDGILEFITALSNSDVKIAIATSGYMEFCRAAFERLGILDKIDAFALSSEVGVNKSNPDIYLLAAKRIGALPERCMVFEDICEGILSAKKAGFYTTAIYDDSNCDSTTILQANADIYITQWSDIKY